MMNWNQVIREFPKTHFLQTSEWAELKADVGWSSEQFTWEDDAGKVNAAAQVLIREVRLLRLGRAFRVGYVPRGPLLDWGNLGLSKRVLDDLEKFARKEKLIFLKIDPEVEVGRGIPGTELAREDESGRGLIANLYNRKWRYSPEQVQFKNTVLLNLDGTEDDWLARMKQKTRYNIRLSQKNGVHVRTALPADYSQLYKMYAETAARDGFIIRPEDYYIDVWSRFILTSNGVGLIAEVEGVPVAGLILIHFGTRAWYVYGMSTRLHREKMPNYLLQWEAMRHAKSMGCQEYDLWGAPDEFSLEDPMSGVYKFKEGLGGVVVRTIGAWDLPVRKTLYLSYQVALPRLLDITRAIRRKQLKREVA